MTEHHFEYRTKLVHCDHCQVRTICRVLDGLATCDRCYPKSDLEWAKTVEEYNNPGPGDEVRCIHCNRRIMFSHQDNAWIHWDANRLECQPTTYAQPPTNYRP